MGLEFLARVRKSSVGLAAIAGLAVGTYRAPLDGLALALGGAWSLVNLALIERLVTALTGPDRGTPKATGRAVLAVAAMLPLFAAGAALLTRLSPGFLAVGFVVPFAVIVMKAVSTLVLESRAWRAIVASPFRATAVVSVLALAAWWAVPHVVRGESEPPHAPVAAGATAHAPEAAGHGEESEGPQKFANVITVLHRAFPDAAWSRFLHHYETIVYSLFVALLLCLVAWLASRRPQMIPGPLQNAVEMLVEMLHDFITSVLGEKHAARFVPFLGSLFVYILAMNLIGLVPFMDSPTSSLNVTFALAITVFVYVQWVGIRSLGPVGYVDHLLGSPRDATGWALAPLMLPIHVMGELAKPISLSCRLFGNIFGEDMLLVAFATLGISVLAFTHLPVGLPLQLPFLFLALLTSTLQALVFTVLSTIYFLLMLPHDDHGHEPEAQHAH